MSLNNLLNQFLGSSNPGATDSQGQGLGQTVSNLAKGIPGGLAGGAAAGGIVALLMSNKSARKYAGKAAKYGGAAMLGGLAFKAYQNWSNNNSASAQAQNNSISPALSETNFHQHAIESSVDSQDDFELTVVKAMIAAAKSDGHIDAEEQQRIFQAVDNMELTAEEKGIVFDSLQKDIPISEIAGNVRSLELKSEIYLASCLVTKADHPGEREYLDKLGLALALPKELLQQLEWQAQQAYAEAA